MTKDQILEFLEFIRQRALCSYSTPHFCDCKYGAMDSNRQLKGFQSHEQTGCPEMRDIIAILGAIPPEIFIAAGRTVHQKALEALKAFSEKEIEK